MKTECVSDGVKVDRFAIVVSQANMPSSCDGSGSYYRIGLLETDGTQLPKRIDERSRGCVRIVETWERLFRGKTDRCAFARAMREAESMRDSLLADTSLWPAPASGGSTPPAGCLNEL